MYSQSEVIAVQKNLFGKRVAVFGANGGLGVWLCKEVLNHGGELVAVVRDDKKAKALLNETQNAHPNSAIKFLFCDLSDLLSVEAVCKQLIDLDIDIIVHNAGAYAVPRFKTNTGYDNVFMINFLSPYYITKRLIKTLEKNGGRVVAVSSVAHNYSKTDFNDVDFSTRKKPSLVYGNAKRFLTYALFELFKHHPKVSLAVTHPGITFTNITAHYPPLVFAVIKHPMKVIFPPPKRAVKCISEGFFTQTEPNSWIGPKLFGVWGRAKKRPLKTATQKEIDGIFKTAEEIYEKIKP